MRIGSDRWNCGFDISLDRYAIYFQIVVAERQSFVQHLTNIHLLFLWFTLAGKRKQVLYHPMGALCLLEKLAHKVRGAFC